MRPPRFTCVSTLTMSLGGCPALIQCDDHPGEIHRPAPPSVQGTLLSDTNGFGARTSTELAIDSTDVSLDGVAGEVEVGGDLAQAQGALEIAQRLSFPIGQRFPVRLGLPLTAEG